MAKTYIKDINEENATDWQRLMFNGLPADVLEKANVSFTTDKFGNVKKPTGVKTVTQTIGGGSDGDEAQLITTYQKDLGTVNGLHLVANYDDKGSLTGFGEWRKTASSSPVSRVYANDDQYFYPQWDATGKANPSKGYEVKDETFFNELTSTFDDLVLQNPALRAAALAYAAPMIGAEVGAATGTTAATGTAATNAAIGLASGKSPLEVAASGLLSNAMAPSTELTGYDAAMADLAASAPPEFVTPTLTGYDAAMADLASSTPAFTNPITANDITNTINDAYKADNIDVGGGYNPATGTGDITTANAAAATGVTSSAGIPYTGKPTTTNIKFGDVIDAVKGGMLINTITGDPLGLGGSGGTGSGGSTGFAQVPVPAEWKSPDYGTIAGPIDLSTILSSKNMLGGTQWQNLPTQRNVTFNDIFAAGQQKTPMGSPVDLNNIVSAILGQTATSQKPA